MQQCISQSNLSTTKAEEANNETVPKKQRYYHIWNNSVTLLLVILLQHKFTFRFNFENFSTTDNTLFNNQHNAIYSLQQRNTVVFGLWSWFSSFEREGSGWKPYNQLPGNSVAASSLLLSQRQEFLNSHLPRVPITPNQLGAFEMREEVLSSVGAQDTDTRGYELSDLEDIEFSWEDSAVDMDSVYRPGIDTPFSSSNFNDFQMEGLTAVNAIIVDDEEDKENSAPTTSTPESERPTEPPRLLRSCPFGTRLEHVPVYVYRTLFC